eukprot:20564_5
MRQKRFWKFREIVLMCGLEISNCPHVRNFVKLSEEHAFFHASYTPPYMRTLCSLCSSVAGYADALQHTRPESRNNE